jgi:SAM-dependent methyltransferase
MTIMDDPIIQRINTLNREFYQTFSHSFSSTRALVQPGVKRMARQFPKDGAVLDLGCGNGNLMKVLNDHGFQGLYAGVDFSENLIHESQRMLRSFSEPPSYRAEFFVFDLAQSKWNTFPIHEDWDVICAFAVFHHIPGKMARSQLFRNIHALLKPRAEFIFSVWQPQNSRRMAKRFVSWDLVGIDADDVEDGDVLLDWKAEQATTQNIGYRYVHIFQHEELTELAEQNSFSIKDSYYSDGKEGNIGLYQIWEKISENK